MELIWDALPERFVSHGVSNGVLYFEDAILPWSGLVSVEFDSDSHGKTTPRYFDGVKYIDEQTRSENRGKITAYTFPDAVYRAGCKFFVFLTKLTDGTGVDHERLHIISNPIFTELTREHHTLSSQPEATLFEFIVSGSPVIYPYQYPGAAPFSYSFFDSRATPVSVWKSLKANLFGTRDLDANYEFLKYIDYHYADYKDITVISHVDGRFSVSGPDEYVWWIDDTTFAIDEAAIINNNGDSYTAKSTDV